MPHDDPRIVNRRPCRSCGAAIGFVETSGSRIARAENPSLKAKQHVVDVKPELRVTAAGETVWVWTSHFVTCPNAAAHRTKKAAGESATAPEGPPAARHPFEGEPCRGCGKRAALAERLPYCVPCWNGLPPAEQARASESAERETAVLAQAEALGRGQGCVPMTVPGGGRALVCFGRGRRRKP